MTLPPGYAVTRQDTDLAVAETAQQGVAIIGLPANATVATLAKTFGNGMATFNYVTTTWLIGADRPIYRLEGSFNSDSFSGYCAAFIGPGHHALACVIVSGLNPGDFDEDEAKEWASQIELSEAP